MKLNTISGCCSMFTLKNNPDETNKKEFLYNLNLAVQSLEKDENISYRNSIKAIVMITNLGFIDRLRYRKLGFRKICTYKGAGRGKAHIMIIKFPFGFASYYQNKMNKL